MFYKLNCIKFSCILSILIISCNKTKEDVYDDLIGSWAIHSIIYKGENYKNHIFSMNVITLREDYSLSIPEIDNYKKEDYAKWKFLYKDNLIVFAIESENKIFDGEYNAQILKLKLTDKIVLKSDNLYLELYKF